MKEFILEGCVDSVESAINASKGGANRLELCGNLIIGGTTPSKALFLEIRKHCKTKIHVLIRPRFGDFCYTDYEFNIIKEEVKMFNDLGAQGVVIGILNPDGTLDIKRMKELMDIAKDMTVTLHRAFDLCKDPIQTMKQAIDLGIKIILTSGQESNCLLGKELIKNLIKKSAGAIEILVAGGVCGDIIEEIYQTTKATSYHMSGKITKDSAMSYRKEGVNMGLPSLSEFVIWQTDEDKIKEARKLLDCLDENR